MPITPDDVRYGYLFVLNREPESEAIAAHSKHADISEFRSALLRSEEFRAKYTRLPTSRGRHPYQNWDAPAIAFIHIPKTAGTTLHDLVSSHFDAERICPERFDRLHLYSPHELAQYDYFGGHFDHFSLRFVPKCRVCSLSIFRNPRDRLLSWYRFCKSHPNTNEFSTEPLIRLAWELGPEEFFSHPTVRCSPLNNSYIFYFGTCLSDATTLRKLDNSSAAAEIINLATKNVLSLDGIAITERFEESVRLIFKTLGWRYPDAVVPKMITDQLPEQDVRFTRAPPIRITPRLVDALAPLIRYDQEVYDVALREFERRLRLSSK